MKIGVVGSLNMDMSLTTERIPLKGETLMGGELRYAPGGKGANQAYAIAKFGTAVTMFGCVGDDANGVSVIENLKQAGVCTDPVSIVKGCPTGLAIITIGAGDNTIVVIPGANDQVSQDYIERVKQELLRMDMVLLQQEIPEETVEYVIELCHEHHIQVVLNPAPARVLPLSLIEKVDYLTPNEHEVSLIFEEVEELSQVLRRYPEKLIVTQGEKGAIVCKKDGTLLRIPARAAQVRDTTGAGDTFNGILTAMIAEGSSLEMALSYSNTGAGLSTEQFGAQGGMPDRKTVEACLLSSKGEG